MAEAMYQAPGCGCRYWWKQCVRARIWLEVGETDDCIMDAMYQEPGCGWR